ncbi:MAG: hypothetical protein FWD68_10015 [Alphaproteobacteria bacterium]|nr:hypothetical protein [Alphaproteobacteria bacterium]
MYPLIQSEDDYAMHTASGLESQSPTYSSENIPPTLKADTRAEVKDWVWATGSMSQDVPFLAELTGCCAPYWVDDAEADPQCHVHHGLDAQGRIIFESCRCGEKVIFYRPQQRLTIVWDKSDRVARVGISHYEDGRLVAVQLRDVHGFRDTRFEYHGERLKLVTTEHVVGDNEEEVCRCGNIFSYDADGVLGRVDLVHLDKSGEILPDPGYVLYMRLPDGETLATIETRVQLLLEKALSDVIREIPRDEAFYCMMLCYCRRELGETWPPALVWGRESHRSAVRECRQAENRCLWWPGAMLARSREKGEDGFHRLEDGSLADACLLHAYLMVRSGNYASASRVLENTRIPLERMLREAGVPVTDDFVVAYADVSADLAKETERIAQLVSSGRC